MTKLFSTTMKTLTISSSGLSMSTMSMSTQSLLFRHSPIFLRFHRNTHPAFSLSSNPQVDLDYESPQIYQSNTVPVKFQIQKECLFGDEFVIVGDDPMFGLWDPDCGIPLTWSEGHVWTVDMDMPIGKIIQFKFILKASTGAITWQPGRDRTFQSWETNNTITVCEDWEDPDQQKLIENKRNSFLVQNEESAINSEMSAVALTYTEEERMAIPLKPVKAMAIIADNIGNPKKDFVVNAANDFFDSKDYVFSPVLVPGLTSFSSFLETEEAVQTIRGSIEVSDRLNDAEIANFPELEKKREHDVDTYQHETTETFSNDEEDHAGQHLLSGKAEDVENEEEHLDILKQQLMLAKFEPNNKEVIVNGIQWGLRALRKMLANLGLGFG